MSEAVTGLTTYNYNSVPVTPTLGADMLGSIVNSGSLGYTLSYGYDELGRVVSRVLDGGTTATVYDALGRVTQVTNPLGTFTYVPYYATGMIDHINYPNGQVVQYGYYPTSADERLETITNLAPGSSGTISQFSYGYNAAGDITSWARQSGTNSSNYQYGYDAAEQLLAATPFGSGTGVAAYGYGYDAAGNRTVEQIAAAVTTSTFNSLNQMTSRGGGGLLTLTGTLDRPGTVTVSGTTCLTSGSNNAFTVVAPVVTGSNNILISATNVNGYGVTKTIGVNVTGGTAIPALTYDSDGNLTNDSTLTYGWDAVNRLTAVNYPTGAYSTFDYDGMGRRAQIIETSSSGSVTSIKNLVWESMNISEEKNASGAVTKRYFPQGVQIGGTNYYYTRDHLGSVRELTDGSGTVQARYDYDPYGRQTQLTGMMSADFGFTGFYVHQPSGLALSMFRPYIPPLGRWGSRDPIAELGGINLYAFCLENPINRIDALGLDCNIIDTLLAGFTYISPALNDAVDAFGNALDNLDSAIADTNIATANEALAQASGDAAAIEQAETASLMAGQNALEALAAAQAAGNNIGPAIFGNSIGLTELGTVGVAAGAGAATGYLVGGIRTSNTTTFADDFNNTWGLTWLANKTSSWGASH